MRYILHRATQYNSCHTKFADAGIASVLNYLVTLSAGKYITNFHNPFQLLATSETVSRTTCVFSLTAEADRSGISPFRASGVGFCK